MRTSFRLSTIVIAVYLVTGCARSHTRTVRTTHAASATPTVYTTETNYTTDEPPVRTIRESTPSPEPRQSVLAASRQDASGRQSPYNIDFEELRTSVKNRSALIVDARSTDQYALGHVRGAVNIPVSEKGPYRDRFLQSVPPDQMIIIYCSSASCHSSDMLAERLMAEGFTNIRVFSPGWQVLSRQRDLR